MSLIFLGVTVLLVWIHLAGLGAALLRWIPHYPIAKAAGLLAVWLIGFFIEHMHGLGRLDWLLPVTTCAAGWSLYLHRERWRSLLLAELPFTLAFLYILAWRYGFPDIYPSSERITDHFFISNFMPGDTLPPVDKWFPPYAFNYYYTFQFYGAAMLARLFDLDAGTVYQLAFCVLFALSASLVWWVITQLLTGHVRRVLLVLAVCAGGTGISVFAPLLMSNDKPEDSVATRNYQDHLMWVGKRFIGSSDRHVNTELGEWLFPIELDDNGNPVTEQELPLETFGYYSYLGDYHPPMSSYVLLFLALACIVWLDKQPDSAGAAALLAGSVPLTLATNAWMFPLQALLVGAWVGYRAWQRVPIPWLALLGGGFAVALLLFPFLNHFSAQALSTPIKWVPADAHTPLHEFVALHWPLLVLLGVLWWEGPRAALARFFVLIFVGLYVLSELIYVGDGTSGQFLRTNTAMKWWGWLYAGATLTWGAYALASPSRWQRGLGVLAVTVLAGYSVMLVNQWIGHPRYNQGHLQGHRWITYDPTEAALLQYLRAMPPGIVLESKLKDAYNRNPLLSLMAGHTAYLGWVHHLIAWGRPTPSVMARATAVDAFYQGEKADALTWLRANSIDYVVWNVEDNRRNAKAWATIQGAIAPGYFWHEFYAAGEDYRIGIWARIPAVESTAP